MSHEEQCNEFKYVHWMHLSDVLFIRCSCDCAAVRWWVFMLIPASLVLPFISSELHRLKQRT